MDTLDMNDQPMFTWECVFCGKCYPRGHDWVYNRYEEHFCKFCNQKLGYNPDADLVKRQKLVQECREELKKRACTRDTCGPLLPNGECIYHGETTRSE